MPEIIAVFAAGINLKPLIHTKGDGFFNLTPTEAAIGHHIHTVPPPLPIFTVLQDAGHLTDTEMYLVHNIGIGPCVIVAETAADRAMRITAEQDVRAWQIGMAVESPERTITIEPRRLQRREGHFILLK